MSALVISDKQLHFATFHLKKDASQNSIFTEGMRPSSKKHLFVGNLRFAYIF